MKIFTILLSQIVIHERILWKMWFWSIDLLLVLSLYKEDYLQMFKCVSFLLRGFHG